MSFVSCVSTIVEPVMLITTPSVHDKGLFRKGLGKKYC